MPKIQRKKEPVGWEIIEPTLDKLGKRMKEAENDPLVGRRRVETSWDIFRIHHQRTRYIYEMYFKQKLISKELYDYCIKNKFADAGLIAKWKKSGYDKLCCLRCIQPKDTNFGTTCICRIPKDQLNGSKIVECIHCGCKGCAT